jgi:hypothetical protein
MWRRSVHTDGSRFKVLMRLPRKQANRVRQQDCSITLFLSLS